MTNEEIKALMLELTEQVGKVGEIIRKINENSKDEIDKNSNFDAPRVYGLRIDCDRYKGIVAPSVHCCDVLDIMDMPQVVTDRDSDDYPSELSVVCDGVKLFELK